MLNKSLLTTGTVIIVLGTVIGITAAAGGIKIGKKQEPNIIYPSLGTVTLDSSTDIQSNYEKLKCTKGLFGDIDWTSPGDGKDLKEAKAFNSDGFKSCLSVWWDHESYTQDKHKFNWNLVWSNIQKDSGFILVTTLKTEKGKLASDLAAYYLKMEKGTWKIAGQEKRNREVVGDEISQSPLFIRSNESNLPGLGEISLDGMFWGSEELMAANDQKKICQPNECSGNAEKKDSKELTWDFAPNSTGNNLTLWSANINLWWAPHTGLLQTGDKNIFSNIKGTWTLSN